MKKVLLALIIGLFVGITNVFALSEGDLKTRLTEPYAIGDKVVAVSNDKKVLVEKYFNEHSLSEKDINYIYNALENARVILKNQSADSLDALPSDTKTKLKNIVKDVNANTSVDVSIEKGNLVIYNEDHTVFASITEPVKQTGTEVNVLNLVALISFVVLGVSIVLIRKNVRE